MPEESSSMNETSSTSFNSGFSLIFTLQSELGKSQEKIRQGSKKRLCFLIKLSYIDMDIAFVN